jgi:hypothetical protein
MIKVREFQRKDQDAAFAIWKHGMSVDLGNYWVIMVINCEKTFSKDKMDSESASRATSDSSDASSGPPSRLCFESSSRNILLDASIRNFHRIAALLGLQNK